MVYLAPSPVKIHQDTPQDLSESRSPQAFLQVSANSSPVMGGMQRAHRSLEARRMSTERQRKKTEKSTHSDCVSGDQSGKVGSAPSNLVHGVPSLDKPMEPQAKRAPSAIVRQRRPSESFFEDTSSEEDEDDLVVPGPRSLHRASSSQISSSSRDNEAIAFSPINQPDRQPSDATELKNCDFEIHLQQDGEHEESQSVANLHPEFARSTFHKSLTYHPLAEAIATCLSRPDEIPAIVKIKPPKLTLERPATDIWVRKTFVKTPYPGTTDDPSSTNAEMPDTRDACEKRLSSSPCVRIDRFPSISCSKTLSLQLSIANHPEICARVEISMLDAALYDDEKFFRDIRSAYFTKVLGWPRSAFRWVRRVVRIDVDTMGVPLSELCVADFMKHMSSPETGHKQHKWVSWLKSCNSNRNHRTDILAEPSPCIVKNDPSEHPMKSKEMRSNYGISSAQMPSGCIKSEYQELGTATRHAPTAEAKEFESTESSIQTVNANQYPDTISEKGRLIALRLKFHYGFSFWSIASFFLCIVWLSILSSVLCVILNGASTNSGNNGSYGPVSQAASHNIDLRDSEGVILRLLTGVILGFALIILGVMIEGCLMLGGWIFL